MNSGIALQPAVTDASLTAPQHPIGAPPLHLAEPRAQLIVKLTQLALSAPDIPSALMPALETLVERTAAAGSAYFQIGSGMFRARSASGTMPQGPAMEAILAHGLPADTPLMRALEASSTPLFSTIPPLPRRRRGFPSWVSPASPQRPCWIKVARCRAPF